MGVRTVKRSVIITLSAGLAVIGMITGWWLFHAGESRSGNMVKFESDLTEGLLLGIMKEMDEDKPKFYFIAFGKERTDPSRLFIARFAGHFPQVRGLSSAFTMHNGQLLETASGHIGVAVQILHLKENQNGTDDALVVFPKLPEGQNRFTYRLTEEAGRWTVKFKLPAK